MSQNDWAIGLTRRLFRYVPKDGEEDDYTIRTPPDPLCKMQIYQLPSMTEDTSPLTSTIVWRIGVYNTLFVKRYKCNSTAMPLEFVGDLMKDRDQSENICGTIEIDLWSINTDTWKAIQKIVPAFSHHILPSLSQHRVKFYFSNGVISGNVFDLRVKTHWFFGITNEHLIAEECVVGAVQFTRSILVPGDYCYRLEQIQNKVAEYRRSSVDSHTYTKYFVKCLFGRRRMRYHRVAAFVVIDTTEDVFEMVIGCFSDVDGVKIAPPDRCFVGSNVTPLSIWHDLFYSDDHQSTPPQLEWTDSAFLRWPYWHATISDIVVALHHLPAYVILEIVDRLPWADRQPHRQKIDLIMSLQKSIRSLREANDE